MKTKLLASLLLAGFTCAGGVHAAEAPDQAPHKALYNMAMASSKSTQVVNVEREMYYDFTDACDAWNSNQKFSLNYLYAESAAEKLNSQYTSREAKDGSYYDYAVRRSKNDALEDEFDGKAVRNPDGTGTASYVSPEKKDFALPKNFYFPTQHTVAIIAQALKGNHIFNAQMFDGSDGQGAVEVNVVVGDAVKANDVDAKFADNPLLKSPAHKVSLAFYPADSGDEKAEQESEPDYQMTMILHENGVVSSMQIDYDDFSLKGTLKEIEAAPPPKC